VKVREAVKVTACAGEHDRAAERGLQVGERPAAVGAAGGRAAMVTERSVIELAEVF